MNDCNQAMAKYVQRVRGIDKEGKMVFNAQMVTIGATRMRMIAQMMSAIYFILSSSRPPP